MTKKYVFTKNEFKSLIYRKVATRRSYVAVKISYFFNGEKVMSLLFE